MRLREHHFFQVLCILLVVAPAVAHGVDSASSSAVTVSVDRDLITLLKGAIWVGSIFIAIFAFIGIAFFGMDVRKARTTLHDAQKETREMLAELKSDFEALKGLKDKLEQLGAQLEESEESSSEHVVPTDGGNQQAATVAIPTSEGRTDAELIREVMRSSSYDWTTIGTIQRRTGLPRDTVLETVRKAHDIHISTGRATKDFIFRLKSAE
ncbi:hypothetical protein [Paraburkholderia fungorum]